jgi:hypothetical protein
MGCRNDKSPKQKMLNTIQIKQESEINKINFYFENSLSMNGYLKGENFRQSMAEIIYNFKGDSVHNYFVNTKAHKTDSMLDKIRKGNISVGNTGNSDHRFIFTNAIKNAAGNNLSIVVTDGIYSMSSGGLTLGDVEKDIENSFENALKQNELETVVLKMASNFTGRYYSESCPVKGGIKIDQQRPYYILLFGNKGVIDKALEEIVVIEDLNGYKEQARFLITKDLKVNYTVLTKGEEKAGDYRAKGYSKLFNVKKIEGAQKLSKNNLLLKDRYLQFGIAVDYSNLSISSNYLIDSSNYSVQNNTGYKVVEIKTFEELPKNNNTYKWIQGLNEKGNMNYSHIIVMNAKSKLYGDLKVNLEMNFPSWIAKTGSDNDCEMKNDITTTFAFDRLMKGISKAYEEVSSSEKFFELKINIKP